MTYLDNLIKIKDITTVEGEAVEVFELSTSIDDAAFSEWAAHFRQNYCSDELLELLVRGTGMTKQQYLLTHKFPDAKGGFAPGTRSGDFAEFHRQCGYVYPHWHHLACRVPSAGQSRHGHCRRRGILGVY